MKVQLILFAITIAGALACKQKCANTELSPSMVDGGMITDSFTIELDQSLVYWSGSSPSGSHNGLIKMAGGELYFKGDQINGGEVRVDMRSIENLDIQEETDRKDLEDHLRDADFFNVDTFPVARFIVLGSEARADSMNNVSIRGELEIKGIRKPLIVEGNLQKSELRTFVSIPEFTIDRTDFNIMYQSKKILPSIKDGFIHDDITISIKLTGMQSNHGE